MNPARLSRRTLLAAGGGAAALAATGAGAALVAGAPADAGPARHTPAPSQAAAEVRAEFVHGWQGYQKYAWGHDEALPVSGGHQEFFAPGHPIGLSMIEALDTLYVMQLDDDLARSVDWIKKNVSFDIDANFHVFEAIIRVVGGLLAGYLATKDAALLKLCTDLADRLLPAFTKSPTGIPYTQVNLHTGAVSGTTPPLAEVGTNILEFGLLSKLTNNAKYLEAAKKAYRVTIAKRSAIGLLGTSLDVTTGAWRDGTDQNPNPPVDSFYEYLWGGWALLRDTDCRDWYRAVTTAINKYQPEQHRGHLWYRAVDMNTGKVTGRGASELGAYYAGLLALAGDTTRGAAYHDSWTSVLDKHPVLPEEIDYGTGAVTGKGNELRPEYANSAFNLYLVTGAQKYRDTAYRYFDGFRKAARTANGYTILTDVTTSPAKQGDLTPAYWFAENMKYLYLTFANAPRFDYRNNYLSTEGKILRGLKPA